MAFGTPLQNDREGDWLELVAGAGQVIRVRKLAYARARRLRLSVTTQGVRLTYPPGTPAVQLWGFLRRHAAWLVAKLEDLKQALPTLPPLQAGSATQIFLRGELTALRWSEGAYPRVEKGDTELCLVMPEPCGARALPLARSLLAGFFESQIRRDVASWLGAYVERLQRAPTALRVRPLKSLWGSLDTRDRISLDLSLALAPPDALRYVLVHELAHLKVRSHAPSFWTQVAGLYPDWQEQRGWLRQHGLGLKAELERLTLSSASHA